MSRFMVGLVAAAGATMAALIAFVHGDLIGLAIAGDAAAVGLAAFAAYPTDKKKSQQSLLHPRRNFVVY